MAGYRDDREALREQKEALEREVTDLREALERERSGTRAAALEEEREAEVGRRGSLAIPLAVALVLVAAAELEVGPAVAAAVLVLVALPLMLLALLRRQVEVGAPYEALIVVGGQARQPDGSVRGWRAVRGRVVRVPLVQQVARLDLRAMPLVLAPEGLGARGGVRVEVVAHAIVKIGSDPKILPHAVERFLGQGRERVELAATQTLEGALREIVVGLSPEQLALERREVASAIAKAAHGDLDALGLELLGLWIAEVRDGAGILEKRAARGLEARGDERRRK